MDFGGTPRAGAVLDRVSAPRAGTSPRRGLAREHPRPAPAVRRRGGGGHHDEQHIDVLHAAGGPAPALRPGRPRKGSRVSAISRASSRTATARPDSGTRCSSFAFIRAGGTVQVAAASSTSSQRAPRISPERQAVSTRNSKASAVARWARDARTRARASPTRACGSAFWCWRRTLFLGSAAEMASPAGLSSR